jgi:hypothetical protein
MVKINGKQANRLFGARLLCTVLLKMGPFFVSWVTISKTSNFLPAVQYLMGPETSFGSEMME